MIFGSVGIEENPFLKKDEEKISDSGFDDMKILENLAGTHTLQTHLEEQLEDLRLSAVEKRIAITIIQSLEENGLLQLDIDEIEEMMKFEHSNDEINSVLENVIQNLDPAGIGARKFKETNRHELIVSNIKDRDGCEADLSHIHISRCRRRG